ncbi:hypothetical protein COY28_01600 [Candidatus Woesearchaeota archaeon CG_4_10_14_0_2_um_filter_57_5]|nr:MAG: hypothetical protein AUJ68_03580 [Candidatus Woesearchaeota archaeon CG1_02_57_44]PIZ55686.1 MAG: hypothetical protein COY28_01600 [Candidatus Woesearchaeota archaeon CG_4_10_14_0_2_um_filter_57_5]
MGTDAVEPVRLLYAGADSTFPSDLHTIYPNLFVDIFDAHTPVDPAQYTGLLIGRAGVEAMSQDHAALRSGAWDGLAGRISVIEIDDRFGAGSWQLRQRLEQAGIPLDAPGDLWP